uniref:F-box domain-containing protein n=1 Tax=Populus trichocarpa TaxID=3694 RepID=A0A2K1XFR0_POPTR
MINIDRLNDLPDHVIHKVLSFLYLKQAIQTCVLSKRWRFPWTSLPCLKFDSYRPQ